MNTYVFRYMLKDGSHHEISIDTNNIIRAWEYAAAPHVWYKQEDLKTIELIMIPEEVV